MKKINKQTPHQQTSKQTNRTFSHKGGINFAAIVETIRVGHRVLFHTTKSSILRDLVYYVIRVMVTKKFAYLSYRSLLILLTKQEKTDSKMTAYRSEGIYTVKGTK